jgi:hypothetical protein
MRGFGPRTRSGNQQRVLTRSMNRDFQRLSGS